MSSVINIDSNGHANHNARYHHSSRTSHRQRLNRSPISSSWVYSTFKRRECTRFVPSPQGDLHKCICGRSRKNHPHIDDLLHHSNHDWTSAKNTKELPTDAAGTLEFQGTGEGDKAQFIRLSDTSSYSAISRLLLSEWALEAPKLIITVHGSEKVLDLSTRQRSIIGEGLIRATRTTEAWIMSSGLHSGIGELVGSALHEYQLVRRGRMRALGIAPWGIVDNRDDLKGKDFSGPIPYQTMADPLSKGSVLNAAHTHFLLVDNGTENKWGNEIKFRRQLESSLVRKGLSENRIPMVCLIVEGDQTTIETVKEKVKNNIPVVVCAGTGSNRVYEYGKARHAADLIAYAYNHTDEHGTVSKEVRVELQRNIHQWLNCRPGEEMPVLMSIIELMRRKKLIKIYGLDSANTESSRSFDHAILTAIFNSKHKPDPDKWLKMAMSWDRADIAKTIFAYPHGQDFPVGSLERRLEEALVNDRVEFVSLLMENGVSMHKFLTYKRMEDLYNAEKADYIPIHLKYLFQDVIKGKVPDRYNLIHVGLVVELLMGGTYRCHYTRKKFRLYYELPNERSNTLSASNTFDMPFHELFIWAVLMNRPSMATFMWQKGEEAMAKALVAMKMFKRMAQEAEDDDMNQEDIQELRLASNAFKDKALELLKIGYKDSEKMCYQLLTYELKAWSRHTCLSLAILAQHRDLIAHPCVQNILSDLMMGGLDVRRHSNLKVPLSLLFFPFFAILNILPVTAKNNFIKFKTHEELSKQPKTIKEYLEENEDLDPGMTTRYNESSTSDSSSSTDVDEPHVSTGRHPADKISLIDKRSPRVLHMTNVTFEDETDMTQFESESVCSIKPVKKGDLDFYRKGYEYFNAPITKFWFNLFVYIIFLICFCYVILLKTPECHIPGPEWFIIIYIITFSIENLRSMVLSTPCSLWGKIKNWHATFWNFVETLAIFIFFTGFMLRSMGIFKFGWHVNGVVRNDTICNNTKYTGAYELEMLQQQIGYGRALYCVDAAIWLTRIFKFCSVNKTLGPYVTMAGKMMFDMGSFISLLVVVLVSFGICRQAILDNGRTEWDWGIVRDILMEPYFMLYGEVYAGIIDPCSEENKILGKCNIPGAWIVPTLMTVYLLVANILLLNLLIAVFNNTFARIKQESNKIWACKRYLVIMQYEAHPLFPPPLIVFSHLKILYDKLAKAKNYKQGKFSPDRGLKLFLHDNEEEDLHDWEEELVDDYYRMKRSEDGKCFEELMRAAAERVTKMERHLEEVEQRNTHLRNSIWDISARIVRIEEAGIKFFEHLEIRSRKPSCEDTVEEMNLDESVEQRLNTTRRPSFIHTEEASQDIHAHLNKWKEVKKLQRIRRDSEMWEEHQFQQRSYSNCSNRNSDKVRTSADSSDCQSSEDEEFYSNQRTKSCAELAIRPIVEVKPSYTSMQARRPSLPAKLKYPPIKIEKPDSKQASPAHTRPKSRTPILDSSDSDSSEMIQRKPKTPEVYTPKLFIVEKLRPLTPPPPTQSDSEKRRNKRRTTPKPRLLPGTPNGGWEDFESAVDEAAGYRRSAESNGESD